MIKTLTDLQNAMIATIDRCQDAGVDTLDPVAAAAWYAADQTTVYLKQLWEIYHRAHDAAKTFGYTGVGQISFAEAAIQEEQYQPLI